jgi:uncharacterized membrane protein YqjE
MSLYPIPAPEESQQSITALVRKLFAEMNELIQQQIQLTKTEVREEGRKILKGTLFAVLALVSFEAVLVFFGNFLMIFMMLNRVTIFGAALGTMIVFTILTVIFLFLCLYQIRSAQALLKQETKNKGT